MRTCAILLKPCLILCFFIGLQQIIHAQSSTFQLVLENFEANTTAEVDDTWTITGELKNAGETPIYAPITMNFYIDSNENGVSLSGATLVTSLWDASGTLFIMPGESVPYSYDFEVTEDVFVVNAKNIVTIWPAQGSAIGESIYKTVDIIPEGDDDDDEDDEDDEEEEDDDDFNESESSRLAQQSIVLYPNPITSNQLNIQTNGEKHVLQIYNLSGSLEQHKLLSNKSNQIELNSFGTGMYILVVYNENGELALRERFLIQH